MLDNHEESINNAKRVVEWKGYETCGVIYERSNENTFLLSDYTVKLENHR